VGIIEHEVWINARRETVFNVISTRQGLDSWWGPVVSASSEIGAVIEFDHGHGEPIQMRVVDFASGERFEWENVNTFTDPVNPASEWSGTSISFDLRDGHPTGFPSLDAHFTVDPFTILQFRHIGWPVDARWLAFCNYGWGVTLAGLAEHCEGSGPDGN
jgi:hypothetical protein